MSQVTVHHPSSYGAGGDVAYTGGIVMAVSENFQFTGLQPSVQHTIVWGDGSADTNGTPDGTGTLSVAHTYAAAGSYFIKVRVTATGRVMATDTVTVTATLLRGGEEEPPPENGDYFDPADYTIPEVETWIEENPDELEALIAAEEAGRARSTLLNHLYSLRP